MTSATLPEPVVEPTRYEVSVLPLDHPARRHFTLYVEWRGEGWAVSTGFRECIGRRGNRAWESNPSSRTDRFKKAYRFPLDEAVAIAKKYCKALTVNGYTVEYALNNPEGW